jgi:hypothetical protein
MENQPTINDFDSALVYIAKSVATRGDKQPFIITFLGEPTNQKSRLRTSIKEWLASKEIYGWMGHTDDPYDRIALRAVPNPDYILIEDVCEPQSSDRYSKQTFGKYPDLRVCIGRLS